MEFKDSPKCKIYSCAQIEAQVLPEQVHQTNSPVTKESDLKLVDSAVMDFASKVNLTRYRREELMTLKLSKSAQMPPPYQSSQNINRLDIRRQKDNEPEPKEQFKALRDMLPSLTMGSWDPELLKLISNYHRSLLYPNENQTFKDYNNSRYPPRNENQNKKVSWSDQKPQFEQLPSYNKRGFFDHITTTTTMKPPRMGLGVFGSQKQRPQNQFYRNAKTNNCANETRSFSNNLSSGSLNETKSSYDESLDRTMSDSNNNSKLTAKTDDSEQDLEAEPEWFSFPASRHDVIDLHGFEDEEPRKTTASSHDQRPVKEESSAKMVYDDFIRSRHQSEFSSQQSHRRQSHNEGNNRYHYDMDGINTSSSFNNSGSFNRSSGSFAPDLPNNFFEKWKQQEEFNYEQMQQRSRAGMQTIADVENAMRYNGNMYSAQQQAMQMRSFANMSVPQFFQNAQSFNQNYPAAGPNVMNHGGYNPFVFDNNGLSPTHEQLQLHTAEIMRNAMLRKQFQAQRNFPK